MFDAILNITFIFCVMLSISYILFRGLGPPRCAECKKPLGPNGGFLIVGTQKCRCWLCHAGSQARNNRAGEIVDGIMLEEDRRIREQRALALPEKSVLQIGEEGQAPDYVTKGILQYMNEHPRGTLAAGGPYEKFLDAAFAVKPGSKLHAFFAVPADLSEEEAVEYTQARIQEMCAGMQRDKEKGG